MANKAKAVPRMLSKSRTASIQTSQTPTYIIFHSISFYRLTCLVLIAPVYNRSKTRLWQEIGDSKQSSKSTLFAVTLFIVSLLLGNYRNLSILVNISTNNHRVSLLFTQHFFALEHQCNQLQMSSKFKFKRLRLLRKQVITVAKPSLN